MPLGPKQEEASLSMVMAPEFKGDKRRNWKFNPEDDKGQWGR